MGSSPFMNSITIILPSTVNCTEHRQMAVQLTSYDFENTNKLFPWLQNESSPLNLEIYQTMTVNIPSPICTSKTFHGEEPLRFMKFLYLV